MPAADAWLRGHEEALVRAAALVRLDGADPLDPRVALLQDEAMRDGALSAVFRAQHGDGSWGSAHHSSARIVSTLLVARSLVDVGLTVRCAAVESALAFLAAQALTPTPTIDGRRDGALPCYAAMLADVLMRGGRADAAIAPLTWIANHQQVRNHGDDLAPGAVHWAAYLATRYGGCFGSTSCFIGVVASADALELGLRMGLPVPGRAHELLDGTRELLQRRRLCFAGDGGVLPLVRPTKEDPAGSRWLAPVLPRNYLPDLLDLIGLARRIGVDEAALEPALELTARWQRADGRWPMASRRPIVDAYRPERVSKSKASAWITLRALVALGRT